MPTTTLSLDQILNQLRADVPSDWEKGDRFLAAVSFSRSSGFMTKIV